MSFWVFKNITLEMKDEGKRKAYPNLIQLQRNVWHWRYPRSGEVAAQRHSCYARECVREHCVRSVQKSMHIFLRRKEERDR